MRHQPVDRREIVGLPGFPALPEQGPECCLSDPDIEAEHTRPLEIRHIVMPVAGHDRRHRQHPFPAVEEEKIAVLLGGLDAAQAFDMSPPAIGIQRFAHCIHPVIKLDYRHI